MDDTERRSMAILAMSPMGILPMVCSFLGFCMAKNENGNSKETGGTPVILMGKMPMLHKGTS
jgi:hypothetical protein